MERNQIIQELLKIKEAIDQEIKGFSEYARKNAYLKVDAAIDFLKRDED